MKKKNLVLFALLLLTIFLCYGCASGPKNIEELYPDRIEKTIIGMDYNEFKIIWPEATKVGFDETYEFVYTHMLIDGAVYDYKIITRFYFLNGKLLKYESTKTYSDSFFIPIYRKQ